MVVSIRQGNQPKAASPLSRLLRWLGAGNSSAKRRGEPQPYGKDDQRPLAEDVMKTLLAASPWFAEQVRKGVTTSTLLYLSSWNKRVDVRIYPEVKLDEMDNALQGAITMIGRAHKMSNDRQVVYNVTGAGPSSATLRAALRSAGYDARAQIAHEVETHLLRMGVDPGDLIWNALGMWPPDDPWAGTTDMKPWVP